MDARNITVTRRKAIEWYNSGDTTLKGIALEAFSKEELECNFEKITTFKEACKALGLNYGAIYIRVEDIATFSRASAAMFKLNIVRKALNLGYDLHLTKKTKNSQIWYPFNPIITKDCTFYKGELNAGIMEVIGKIKNEETLYSVLGGYADCNQCGIGLSYFDKPTNVGYTEASIGFLGCATKEVVEHFGKYFGVLITEAKYADMVDFEVIEDKYGNTK